MKELLIKILDNNIMYYIIVPLIVVFLGWIKNAYDIKEKNKELGYWIKKYKRLKTFIDISMQVYKWLTFVIIFSMIIRIIVELFKGKLMSYIIGGTIYSIIGIIIVVLVWRKTATKIEFLTNGKSKKILLISLYLIFLFGFFVSGASSTYNIFFILFVIMLLIWIFCLYRYSDIAFILDNSFADIYVKGSDKAELVEAGNIEKKGEWIIVRRYINGYDEELRIKESDIVRIDYYGGPFIYVKKIKICKKN